MPIEAYIVLAFMVALPLGFLTWFLWGVRKQRQEIKRIQDRIDRLNQELRRRDGNGH